MDKFRNAKGRLTPYAFACGYIEKKEVGSVAVTLWQEHFVFHVRAHDHEKGERLFWDSFNRLSDARARFDNGRAERAA